MLSSLQGHVDRVIDRIHRGMIDSPSFHIIMRSRYDCGESCGSFALVLEYLRPRATLPHSRRKLCTLQQQQLTWALLFT
jgi:hypothetical protein